ncbi:alpha/beta hydrolase [Candidatus Saccharibacteria bacterium]|nr:alpha/beta hydrolase [Candidatus Saccharibacteria bacterium]
MPKKEVAPLTFDERWQTIQKKKVSKEGSPARYTDLRPEGWEDNPPVLIAGGWSVGKGSLRETARVLYENGRRVVIVDSGRYEKPQSRNGRLKAVKNKAKECLEEFALKVGGNVETTASVEQPPRPQPTWDDEYLRIKTAVIKGSKRVKAALKNARTRIKSTVAERRTRTKTLPEDLHPVIAGQAEALMDIIDDSRLEKVEIVSHSAGSLPALIAAQRRPELFSKLALTMPAGMFEDSVKELLKRYRPKLIRSLTKDTFDNPRTGLSINLGGSAYIIRNPLKSYREIDAITSTRIRKALSELSNRDDIKIAVLQANADPLFPAEKISDNIITRHGDRDSQGKWRKANEPLVNAYSSFIDRRAGHDNLMINPEDSTAAVLDILEHM